MEMRDQRHATVSKQTTLFDGVDVCPPNGEYMGVLKSYGRYGFYLVTVFRKPKTRARKLHV